jgi:tetratricopeptide (TPR) repeat protein
MCLSLFDCQASGAEAKKAGFLDQLFKKQPLCPEAESYKQEKKLEQAVNAYEACVNTSMSKKQKQQIQKDIDLLKTEIVSKTLEEAASAFGNGQNITAYENAIRILDAKKRYDRGNIMAARIEGYRNEIENLHGQIRKYLETALAEETREHWGKAVQAVNQAMILDPSNSTITARLANVIEKRNEYFKNLIRKACSDNDYDGASKILKTFKEEQPAPSTSVLMLMDSLVNETQGKVVRSEAGKLITDKKYFAAYSQIQETGVANCQDLLKVIRREGSEFYKNLAKEEKTNKVNDFHAYIAAVKAKQLNPGDNEIFNLHQDMTDIVNDSIQIKIGIAFLGSPTAESGAGKEFAGMLISHLGKLLPYGISIDEPEKIKLVIERGTSESDVPVQLGQKLAIFGDVSTLDISPLRNVSEKKNFVACTVGEEEIPNPEYSQQCEDMRARYGRDRGKWPPPLPSPTITRPRIQTIDYMSGEKQVKGRMVVSLRPYSAASNASIGSETFSVQRDFSDTFQEGVPCAGIPADSLELPSELEMKQELKQAMVEKASKWILDRDLDLNLGFFQLRQKHYYKEAENFIERREYNEAVKVLAQGYLYCLKDNIPENDEWFQKIRKKVLCELTE